MPAKTSRPSESVPNQCPREGTGCVSYAQRQHYLQINRRMTIGYRRPPNGIKSRSANNR
jgi:hypothetical protein